MATWTFTASHMAQTDNPAVPNYSKHQFPKADDDDRQSFDVLAKLREFRREEKLCDLIVQVNKTKFSVHKAVLAAWSPKIANLVVSHSGAKDDLTLWFECDDVDAFSQFLDYCYSGSVSPTEQTIHPLLDIAKNFTVSPLMKLGEEYLKSSLSPNNLVSRLITSVKYGLKSLEKAVVDYIHGHLASFVEQPEMLNLRPQDLEVFLSSGRMGMLKPEIKLSLIINWAGWRLAERTPYLMYLLGRVAWDKSVTELLLQISCTDNIFTSSELCLFQLLQGIINSTGDSQQAGGDAYKGAQLLGPFIGAYPRLYSLYSHMIDDLTRPNVFSTSSSKIEDVIDIPVTVVPSHHIDSGRNTKDAEVNTDVDSTYFQELHSLHSKETASGIGSVISDFADRPLDENSIQIQSVQSLEETEAATISEIVTPVSNHRRKGRPRKIANNETKEKKARGRPKKANTGKDSGKLEMIIPLIKIEDQPGFSDIKIAIANESDLLEDPVFNGSYVDEDNLQADDTLGSKPSVPDNSDTPEETKTEVKPKLKFSFNLKNLKTTKAKGKRGRKPGQKNKKPRAPPGTRKLLPTLPKIPRINKRKLERIYKCTEENCQYAGRTNSRLQSHIENCHNQDILLQCHQCDYTTNQMRELCLHLKTHYDKTPYPCAVEGCDLSFLRISQLVRHQMVHMDERPYKCDLCDKSFPTLNQVRCHKKLHEGRQFECDICQKRFTTKGVMQCHRAVHFDNKPYMCETCGFSTKHLSHLISHRKIHTGDVLRCSFPNCNYTTPKQGHMTQHVNTHLNIRNHICQVCGKSFVVRSKLIRHELIHLKQKLLKCKQCDYQTSRKDRMKLHIESHGIKLKKKLFNLPDNIPQKPDIDYHQFYEQVPISREKLGTENTQTTSGIPGLTDHGMVSLADIKLIDIKPSDMKPMDPLSLAAASASMIVESYNSAPRMMIDPITGETDTSVEDTLTTFQQGFERLHAASFDQL